MPTLRVSTQLFDQLLGEKLTLQQLDTLTFQFGIQHEGVQDHQYKLDIANNRPDLLSLQGVTAALSTFIGTSKPLQVKIAQPGNLQKMMVHAQTNEVRPFVSCAILRGMTFTKQVYDSFIKYQDKLHKTLCKQRSLASIGTHDLDTITAPFRYQAHSPAEIMFQALNQPDEKSAQALFADLQKDTFLKTYLPIIRDKQKYPVIKDNKGIVCSLPPIINGQHSKITLQTRNVLVEVTGTDRKRVEASLKCLVWSFARYCQGCQVQQVQVCYPDNKIQITPDLSSKEFMVLQKNVSRIVGQQLDPTKVQALLSMMGLTADKDQASFRVKVPFYRTDILHEVDILQDVAIAYGYSRVQTLQLQSRTVGRQNYLNKVSGLVREQLAIAGYNEVLTFALCSTADMTTLLNRAQDKEMVRIGNPKNYQFEAGRTTLKAGLLKALYQNKMHKLPLKIFQVGDVMVKDDANQTGSSNVRMMAAALTDEVRHPEKSLFSLIHGLTDRIMKKFRIPIMTDEGCRLREGKNSFFMQGQQAEIVVKGKRVGEVGIVHARVLKEWDWQHPIAMLEMRVESLAQSIRLG